jgi:hypothetical protein
MRPCNNNSNNLAFIVFLRFAHCGLSRLATESEEKVIYIIVYTL